jgi:hypothetical protein
MPARNKPESHYPDAIVAVGCLTCFPVRKLGSCRCFAARKLICCACSFAPPTAAQPSVLQALLQMFLQAQRLRRLSGRWPARKRNHNYTHTTYTPTPQSPTCHQQCKCRTNNTQRYLARMICRYYWQSPKLCMCRAGVQRLFYPATR